MAWLLLNNAVQAAIQHRPQRTGWAVALRHLGGAGLFILAILDSSPIPTFGGLDVLTAVLAARHREPWYYYALISTAGSIVGAYITYEIGHKAGEAYLARKFGTRRVQRLLGFVRRRGRVTLIISTLLPPPFPATAVFAAAGVLEYPARRYGAAIFMGRIICYSLLAWAGAKYGRHFVRLVRHPERYVGWSAGLGAVVLVVILAAVLFWLWSRRVAAEHAREHAASPNFDGSNQRRA